jgi:hypothetical protein
VFDFLDRSLATAASRNPQANDRTARLCDWV